MHVVNNLKLHRVLSNQVSTIIIWHTSIFLKPSIVNFSHIHTGAFAYLLFNYPKRVSYSSISSTETTLTLSKIYSFLKLSLLLWPHIQRNIFIFTTFIFWMWDFLTGQNLDSYILVDLPTILKNLCLRLGYPILSQDFICKLQSHPTSTSTMYRCQSPYLLALWPETPITIVRYCN